MLISSYIKPTFDPIGRYFESTHSFVQNNTAAGWKATKSLFEYKRTNSIPSVQDCNECRKG